MSIVRFSTAAVMSIMVSPSASLRTAHLLPVVRSSGPLAAVRRVRGGATSMSTTATFPSIKVYYGNMPFWRAECVRMALAIGGVPFEDVRDKSWRMKINILDSGAQSDRLLPTAETCFFNVNMPLYSSFEIMREKLLFAITHCAAITS